MRDEAKVEDTEEGRVPADDGWYILNLSEIRWATVPGGGTWCGFGSPNQPSDRIGIGVHILWPGDAPGYYHEEDDLEGFLVLSGECIAIVEGEERHMGPWDYLHSPPARGTSWSAPATGRARSSCTACARPDATILYPVERDRGEARGSVATETDSPEEAYRERPPIERTARRGRSGRPPAERRPQSAARSFGATCFLRLMTPGRSSVPSFTGCPKTRSSGPCSPATSIFVPLAMMSVTISA